MNRRLQKEMEMLSRDPGPGISVWQSAVNTNELNAQIIGPEGSPYANGVFSLVLNIPEKYPFEPPRVRFVTPVYHPNIDSDGRICLDTLKMQPQGSWSPSININTLLITIRVLLAHPNADDGLVPDITELYRRDIVLFKQNALAHTREHALPAPAPVVYEAVDPLSGAEIDRKAISAPDAPVPSEGGDSESDGDSSISSSSDSESDDGTLDGEDVVDSKKRPIDFSDDYANASSHKKRG